MALSVLVSNFDVINASSNVQVSLDLLFVEFRPAFQRPGYW